jgi:hypothetical protein
MNQKYWEDYKEGDEIPKIDKIATTQTLIKWAGACGDFVPFHFEQDMALALGMKGVIVHGNLKRDWLIQMMTEFAGEEGFLKKISCKHIIIDYPRKMKTLDTSQDGETWQCKGNIVKKYQEYGEHFMDCDIWVENGKGERTTIGAATVILPVRQ